MRNVHVTLLNGCSLGDGPQEGEDSEEEAKKVHNCVGGRELHDEWGTVVFPFTWSSEACQKRRDSTGV